MDVDSGQVLNGLGFLLLDRRDSGPVHIRIKGEFLTILKP